MSTTRIQQTFAMGSAGLFLGIALSAALTSSLLGQLAQISHFVSPAYPPLARQAMISGQVSLRLTVDADGAVKEISAQSSTHPLLTETAKSSAGEWRFQPGTADRKITAAFYFGFSGTVRKSNPTTTVKADFAGSTVHVYVTTDGFPTVHP